MSRHGGERFIYSYSEGPKNDPRELFTDMVSALREVHNGTPGSDEYQEARTRANELAMQLGRAGSRPADFKDVIERLRERDMSFAARVERTLLEARATLQRQQGFNRR